MRAGFRGLLNFIALATLCWWAPPARAADTFVWRAGQNQVDAEIEAWPLPKVLESIASATGWQIYLQPDTRYTVTTRFHKLKPPDALRRLLGELNFALLPQSGGPTKLFIYRTSVNEATQLIRTGGKSKAESAVIPNELIVALKPGAKEGIDALAKRLGAKVVGRLDGLNAYRLQFDNEAAAQSARAELESDSNVGSVENNFAITPPASLEPLAMSSAPPLSLKPDVNPSSDRIIVGLIDTPIQRQGSVIKDFLLTGLSLYGDYQPPADQVTHATAMAETILDGVARALRENGNSSAKVPLSILPIDIYGGNESTSTFDVARGIFEALNRHANIINLSLSGESDSELIRSLVQEGAKKGVLFFAAAGNTPVTTPSFPAADPGVIGVTAGDAQGNIAPYANRGAFVQAIAPGLNVVHFQNQAWFGTGTSFSTAWVGGWAAGTMANSSQTAAQIQSQTLTRWGIPAKR